MPVQGDYYSEFAPNQVTVPLRDNKSSLESSDSLRKESPSDIAIDKNQFKRYSVSIKGTSDGLDISICCQDSAYPSLIQVTFRNVM